MLTLQPLIAGLAADLKRRGETIAIAESSTGGLISAALLSGAGASAYFVGGAVIYTKTARAALLGIGDTDMAGVRPSSEAYALLLARRVRDRHGADWGLGETGAAGPTGNRYGNPAGHCCVALAGPGELAVAITIATASTQRDANMRVFAERALKLLGDTLANAPPPAKGTP